MSSNIDYLSFGGYYAIYATFGLLGLLTNGGLGLNLDSGWSTLKYAFTIFVLTIWAGFVLFVFLFSSAYVFDAAGMAQQIANTTSTNFKDNQNDLFAWICFLITGVACVVSTILKRIINLFSTDAVSYALDVDVPVNDIDVGNEVTERLLNTTYDKPYNKKHRHARNDVYPASLLRTVVSGSTAALLMNYLVFNFRGYNTSVQTYQYWNIMDMITIVFLLLFLLWTEVTRITSPLHVYVADHLIFVDMHGAVTGYRLRSDLALSITMISANVGLQYYMGYGAFGLYGVFCIALPLAVCASLSSLDFWWEAFTYCQALWWTATFFFNIAGFSATNEPYLFPLSTFNAGNPWSTPPAQTLNTNIFPYDWSQVKLAQTMLSTGAMGFAFTFVVAELARVTMGYERVRAGSSVSA
jgi:hypothetical protein